MSSIQSVLPLLPKRVSPSYKVEGNWRGRIEPVKVWVRLENNFLGKFAVVYADKTLTVEIGRTALAEFPVQFGQSYPLFFAFNGMEFSGTFTPVVPEADIEADSVPVATAGTPNPFSLTRVILWGEGEDKSGETLDRNALDHVLFYNYGVVAGTKVTRVEFNNVQLATSNVILTGSWTTQIGANLQSPGPEPVTVFAEVLADRTRVYSEKGEIIGDDSHGALATNTPFNFSFTIRDERFIGTWSSAVAPLGLKFSVTRIPVHKPNTAVTVTGSWTGKPKRVELQCKIGGNASGTRYNSIWHDGKRIAWIPVSSYVWSAGVDTPFNFTVDGQTFTGKVRTNHEKPNHTFSFRREFLESVDVPPVDIPCCPTDPPGYSPRSWWARRTVTVTNQYRSVTVTAVAESLISQADANNKAKAKAEELGERKLTHQIAPVGSKQLSDAPQDWHWE